MDLVIHCTASFYILHFGSNVALSINHTTSVKSRRRNLSGVIFKAYAVYQTSIKSHTEPMKSFTDIIEMTTHLDLEEILPQEADAKQQQQEQQSQMIHLFDLPQELLDKIYVFYSFASPCREGPLKGYVKPAPPAPLRASKKMLKAYVTMLLTL